MSEGGWGRLQKLGGEGEEHFKGWHLVEDWRHKCEDGQVLLELPGWERPTQVVSPEVWIEHR